jgi:lipopolysaccharide/colanic/teichoic acid biosynthesis glycosyltransferase
MKFRNRFGWLARDPLSPPVEGVRSREDFRKALERERAVSDRTEHEFSLLVFDGELVRDPAALRGFARILTRRIRQIDEIGWFDQRLAVLLPFTSAGGANTLAEELCNKVVPARSCTIYTYPDQWLPDESNRRGSLSSSGRAQANGRQKEGSAPGRGRSDGLFANRVPTWKRAIDIAGSLTVLACLSPLFLLVAIVIKVVSPGPVFYRQNRVGRNRRVFEMLKFRTMRTDADSTLHQRHLSSLITGDSSMTKLDALRDPRIFAFGNIIRRSYVDELPQLFNVLRGDMSLVGPRPCLPYEMQEYRLWQTRRFDSLPGMTGLWQVSGKNKTTFKEMMRFDISYSRRCSFWLDVSVLLRTVPAILVENLDTVSNRKGTSETVSEE